LLLLTYLSLDNEDSLHFGSHLDPDPDFGSILQIRNAFALAEVFALRVSLFIHAFITSSKNTRQSCAKLIHETLRTWATSVAAAAEW